MSTTGVIGDAPGSGVSSASNLNDEAALFQKMIEGVVSTGLSIGSSLIGDTIEAVNDESAAA